MFWLIGRPLHEPSSHNKLPPLPQTEAEFILTHRLLYVFHGNASDTDVCDVMMWNHTATLVGRHPGAFTASLTVVVQPHCDFSAFLPRH